MTTLVLAAALSLSAQSADLPLTAVTYQTVRTGDEFAICIQDEIIAAIFEAKPNEAAAELAIKRCSSRNNVNSFEKTLATMLPPAVDYATAVRKLLPPKIWDTSGTSDKNRHFSLDISSFDEIETPCASLVKNGRISNFDRAAGLLHAGANLSASEFETAAAYEQRRTDAVDKIRKSLSANGSALLFHTFAVSVRGQEAPGTLSYSYDAQRKTIKIIYAAKSKNYSAWRDDEVLTSGMRSIPTKLVSAKVISNSKYTGSTAFGTRATVQRTRYIVNRWGFGIVRYGNSDWVNDFQLSFSAISEPEDARLLVPRLRVLLAGQIEEPITYGVSSDIIMPTIDNRADSKTESNIVLAPLVCAVLYDADTRKIISQHGVRVVARPR